MVIGLILVPMKWGPWSDSHRPANSWLVNIIPKRDCLRCLPGDLDFGNGSEPSHSMKRGEQFGKRTALPRSHEFQLGSSHVYNIPKSDLQPANHTIGNTVDEYLRNKVAASSICRPDVAMSSSSRIGTLGFLMSRMRGRERLVFG